jgi:hypothetical protein
MARGHIAAALALAVPLGAAASPAADLGGSREFRVNTYTTGAQDDPAVAAQGANVLVAWESGGQDGSLDGVVVRLAGRRDGPSGPEFLVNTYTTGTQDDPAVAGLLDGSFVAVWESAGQDGSGEGLFGRLLSPDGEPMGEEFGVNTRTTGNQDAPSVAPLPDGGFVVVWEDFGADGDGEAVTGRRFDAAGQPVGAEFRVNEGTAGAQYEPALAGHGQGFIVAWATVSSPGDEGSGIVARRFDAQGTPLGGELAVNTFTTGEQTHPAVAASPDGAFVVAWASYGQDGSGFGVHAQRFDAAGGKQGGEFQANTYTTGAQLWPAAAMAPDGAVLLVWESAGQDGSGDAVIGRLFGEDGAPRWPEQRINGSTVNAQEDAAVAVDARGAFLAVWEGADGGSDGVHGRRLFRAPRP